METILEQQRRYHEEKERLMDVMAKEMLTKKSTVSEPWSGPHQEAGLGPLPSPRAVFGLGASLRPILTLLLSWLGTLASLTSSEGPSIFLLQPLGPKPISASPLGCSFQLLNSK